MAALRLSSQTCRTALLNLIERGWMACQGKQAEKYPTIDVLQRASHAEKSTFFSLYRFASGSREALQCGMVRT